MNKAERTIIINVSFSFSSLNVMPIFHYSLCTTSFCGEVLTLDGEFWMKFWEVLVRTSLELLIILKFYRTGALKIIMWRTKPFLIEIEQKPLNQLIEKFWMNQREQLDKNFRIYEENPAPTFPAKIISKNSQ